MQKISYRQLFTMAIMTLPITGHVLLIAPLLAIARRDAWVPILAALPIGLLYGLLLAKLHAMHPDLTLPQMMKRAFGKHLGGLLGFIQIGLFVYFLIITFKTVIQFIQIFFLPETSQWVIGLVFYAAVLFTLRLGIEPVARFSEPMGMLIPFTGTTVGLASLAHKDYSMLLPAFESSPSTFAYAMLMVVALYGEMIYVLQFSIGKGSANAYPLWRMNSFGILFVTFTFFGAVTGCLALFGDRFPANSEYPTMATLSIVSLGFVERVDVYGIFTLILGSLVRIPMYHHIIERTLGEVATGRRRRPIRIGLTLLVITSALMIRNNLYFIEIWVGHIYPWTATVSIGLPVMTWLVLLLREAHQPQLAPS